MDSSNYPALKTEIDNDPKGLGYVSTPEGEPEIVTLMNTVGLSGDTVNDRGEINTSEITSAIVWAEYNALSETKKENLRTIISAGKVDISHSRIIAFFSNTFSAPSETRDNLFAVAARSVSRAEKLFGQTVDIYDVHEARKV